MERVRLRAWEEEGDGGRDEGQSRTCGGGRRLVRRLRRGLVGHAPRGAPPRRSRCPLRPQAWRRSWKLNKNGPRRKSWPSRLHLEGARRGAATTPSTRLSPTESQIRLCELYSAQGWKEGRERRPAAGKQECGIPRGPSTMRLSSRECEKAKIAPLRQTSTLPPLRFSVSGFKYIVRLESSKRGADPCSSRFVRPFSRSEGPLTAPGGCPALPQAVARPTRPPARPRGQGGSATPRRPPQERAAARAPPPPASGSPEPTARLPDERAICVGRASRRLGEPRTPSRSGSSARAVDRHVRGGSRRWRSSSWPPRRLPRARTCWAPRSPRPGSRARSASWASARKCSRRCRPRRATCVACRSGSMPRRAPTSTRCSWRGRILRWRR